MIRREIHGSDWLWVAPVDLRLTEKMAVRTISFAEDWLCRGCAKRAAEHPPSSLWSKLDPDQLLEWTELLRVMFGIQTEEPLEVLTERLLTWWRSYKRNPSAAKFICRPGGQR
jgi:hypothetical protein